MSVVKTMLSGHDLFRLLGAEEIEAVSRISAVKRFTRDETIHEHHALVSHVFLCLEGTVLLQLPARASELRLTIAQIGKGELFGVAPLLGIDRYTTSARAAGPVEALAIEAKGFQRIVEKSPVVAHQLMSRVAQVYFGRYLEVMRRLQGVLRELATPEA